MVKALISKLPAVTSKVSEWINKGSIDFCKDETGMIVRGGEVIGTFQEGE